MTYQELITDYPWLDLAWEIFKGVSPTVLALVTILLTEHCIRKRNNNYKKREVQLQYLEKILSWIHDTQRSIFEISSTFGRILCVKDIENRVTEYNENIKMITEMNKSIFVWCDTYDDVTKSFGYDFKLKEFKDSINAYSKQITNIVKKYLSYMNTEEAVNEMDIAMQEVKEKMQESASLLVKKINLLYGKW